MRHLPPETDHTRQKKLAELSQQLRYAKTPEDRHRIMTEMDISQR